MMDYSADFKSQRALFDQQAGGTYRAFVQSLSPRFVVVWRDIALGYLMLLLTLYEVQQFQDSRWSLPAIAIGALSVGYCIAYLQLFVHEAAHYNLSRNRKVNDALCDALLSWQIGTCSSVYRDTHFPHHFKLGQPDDTERSYLNALTPRFLLEMLTGVHAARVFLLRRSSDEKDGPRSWAPLARGVVVHLGLLAIMIASGAWSSALAWLAGVGVVFPFLATLRQLLEHRAPDAPVRPDGSREAVTRVFGDGMIARSFGGAGFNRHLLHHWEPTISYTRLQEYEQYLMTTSMASVVLARRTTYWRAFLEILKADNASGADAV